MKVIIFGATGKTGRLVCCKAIEQGHQVAGFGRSSEKIIQVHASLKAVEGDVLRADDVPNAIANNDVVISCIGSINLKDAATISTGTKNIIDGMSKHGVKRLIALSAAGVNDSCAAINWFSKCMFKTLLRNIFKDHHLQESYITASDLDWTIVRPAILSDKQEIGYHMGSPLRSNSVSRLDVASSLCNQISDKTYIRKAVLVS